MRSGKSSAVADIAAQLGNEGRAVPHTPDAPEECADLFAAEVAEFDQVMIAPPKRGPGRPRGAVSRTTLQLQKLLTAKGYRDPAEFLAAIMTMDTRQLLEALRDGDETTALDALKVQVQAARELMPYFHQKKPIAVEHKGEAHRPLFIINDGDGMAARLADAFEKMSAHDIEEYQEVSDDAAASSNDGGASDEC